MYSWEIALILLQSSYFNLDIALSFYADLFTNYGIIYAVVGFIYFTSGVKGYDNYISTNM